tara:strand:+ start:83 stop:571 length:489 start_codon:yes stop_codon:yes gene_type:complete
MGSDSDLKVMKPAVDILDKFKISNEICILSAHRTPLEMMEYAKNSESNNIKVIIAGAGGSAHLPGMIASLTSIPVIGVPVKTKTLSGIDSLLSIVQMPSGVPVATVAINGSENAGLLAVQICSLFDETKKSEFLSFKSNLHKSVRTKNMNLSNLGVQKYLQN